MGELLQGWKRTHRVGELTQAQIGQEVTLMGWAGTWRTVMACILAMAKKQLYSSCIATIFFIAPI